MRRSDDVFFFTLIDFLLQVFFFGLLIFVVVQVLSQDKAKQEAKEAEARERLLKLAGVSSLTELTDILTKLVPLKDLQGTKEFFQKYGGRDAVEAGMKAVENAGGPKNVSGMVNENNFLKGQLDAAWGSPSCLGNERSAAGKYQPKVVARAVIDDNRITLEQPTEDFRKLLASHNLQFSEVQSLSLADFRSKFAPVVAREPGCRYFMTRTTRTRLLEPVQAVWSAFRTL